eukprot:scaffold51375_cov37-Cyclotella_meneghiniana.AAC.3
MDENRSRLRDCGNVWSDDSIKVIPFGYDVVLAEDDLSFVLLCSVPMSLPITINGTVDMTRIDSKKGLTVNREKMVFFGGASDLDLDEFSDFEAIATLIPGYSANSSVLLCIISLSLVIGCV